MMQGQNQGDTIIPCKDYLKKSFYGRYIGHCLWEQIRKNTTGYPDLCPISLSADSTVLSMGIIEVEFNEYNMNLYSWDSVWVSKDSGYVQRSHKTSTSYDFDCYTNTIIDGIRGNSYKVYFVGNNNNDIILKEETGRLIFLERIKDAHFYKRLDDFYLKCFNCLDN